MKTSWLAIPIGLVALTACSSPYHAKTSLTGGYSDQQLAPDAFRVTYEAPSDSPEASHVKDLALLRATELCRQAGYTHFKITQQSDESGVVSTSNSGLRQPPAPFVMGGGSRAEAANARPRAAVLTTQSTTVVRKIVLEVHAHKEKPAGPGVFEVEPLYARLNGEYR